MESDASLEAQLDGSASAPAAAGGGAASTVEPAGAFLESITVRGFRGIGPAARLELHPAPGVTVISGRNGSGKSSFAEALEFALTGQSYRWRNKPKHWADAWRNMHDSSGCNVRVAFTVEGRPQTTVGVDWKPDDDLDSARVWTQAAGATKTPGINSLGWTQAIELHRPLLTYEEIGGLLAESPSVLHDALAKLLGLEEIQDAENRLTSALRTARVPRQTADAALRLLKATLSASEDPRAATILKALRRPYKLDVIDGVLSGTESGDEGRASLRRVLTLSAPDDAAVEKAAADIEDAEARVAALADAAVATLEMRADLLSRAIRFADAADDDTCPVCDSGVLDDDWRARATAAVTASTDQLAAYRSSRAEVAAARSAAQALIDGIPQIEPLDGVDRSVVDAYRNAVTAARSVVADLPAHLRTAVSGVSNLLAALQSAVHAVLESEDSAWKPIATETSSWLALERLAQNSDARLAVVTEAKNWVTANAQTLRNQRLEPIADRARSIWSQLRQESNVDIGAITLEGRATSRRVQFAAAVDGQPAGALSVMSQGELHALALALFLPRATTEGSPFRFIVLDDPIQAMDPAKIDGFLQVLEELGETRQVIVFSHDDRLASAVRNTATAARLIEVTREAGSKVVVKESQSPASRYTEDAYAVVADENVPDDVKRRAVPALFRQAIESAAQQRFFADQYRDGVSRAEAEELWAGAAKTRARIALALEGDPAADIGGWLSYRTWRRPILGICNAGSHRGADDVPTPETISDLRKMVKDLLEKR